MGCPGPRGPRHHLGGPGNAQPIMRDVMAGSAGRAHVAAAGGSGGPGSGGTARGTPPRVPPPRSDDGQHPSGATAPARLPTWADESVLRYGDLALDPRTREVRRGPRDVDLSRLEFDLLALFLNHPRLVLTRFTC